MSTATATQAETATHSAPSPHPAEKVFNTVHLLAARYANARGRPDLKDDLAGALFEHLVEQSGGYSEARGLPTTWAFALARSRLPRVFARIAYAVRVPVPGDFDASEPHREVLKRARARPVPIGALRGSRDRTFMEPADHRSGGDPPDEAAYRELAATVHHAIETAIPDERQRRVLRACYGIGEPEKTQIEVGRALGISRERVRQIRGVAERRLRAALAGDGEGEQGGGERR